MTGGSGVRRLRSGQWWVEEIEIGDRVVEVRYDDTGSIRRADVWMRYVAMWQDRGKQHQVEGPYVAFPRFNPSSGTLLADELPLARQGRQVDLPTSGVAVRRDGWGSSVWRGPDQIARFKLAYGDFELFTDPQSLDGLIFRALFAIVASGVYRVAQSGAAVDQGLLAVGSPFRPRNLSRADRRRTPSE